MEEEVVEVEMLLNSRVSIVEERGRRLLCFTAGN